MISAGTTPFKARGGGVPKRPSGVPGAIRQRPVRGRPQQSTAGPLGSGTVCRRSGPPSAFGGLDLSTLRLH